MKKILVPVVFEGKKKLKLETVIDTGSSITVLPKNLADVIQPKYLNIKHEVKVGNGRKVKGDIAIFKVTLPDLKCSLKVRGMVIDGVIPPLIGSDFLQKKKIKIDYKKESLEYKNKTFKFLYVLNFPYGCNTKRD